jgi:hypothetical protein
MKANASRQGAQLSFRSIARDEPSCVWDEQHDEHREKRERLQPVPSREFPAAEMPRGSIDEISRHRDIGRKQGDPPHEPGRNDPSQYRDGRGIQYDQRCRDHGGKQEKHSCVAPSPLEEKGSRPERQQSDGADSLPRLHRIRDVDPIGDEQEMSRLQIIRIRYRIGELVSQDEQRHGKGKRDQAQRGDRNHRSSVLSPEQEGENEEGGNRQNKLHKVVDMHGRDHATDGSAGEKEPSPAAFQVLEQEEQGDQIELKRHEERKSRRPQGAPVQSAEADNEQYGRQKRDIPALEQASGKGHIGAEENRQKERREPEPDLKRLYPRDDGYHRETRVKEAFSRIGPQALLAAVE